MINKGQQQFSNVLVTKRIRWFGLHKKKLAMYLSANFINKSVALNQQEGNSRGSTSFNLGRRTMEKTGSTITSHEYTLAVGYQYPIMVAARSKAWTVFARSEAGIVGSNPTQGMDVCVRLYRVLSCVQVAALRRADPPSKEPNRLCKKIKKLIKRSRPNEGLYSHR
jgi:hypothetical protein